MLKYLLLCPKKKKKNLIEFNLIALKNDNIFCILLDMKNWCLNLIEEPNVLHLGIILKFCTFPKLLEYPISVYSHAKDFPHHPLLSSNSLH